MKTSISMTLFAALTALLLGCGEKPAPNTPTSSTDQTEPAPNTASSGGGVECDKEIALVCEEGQIDGCLVQTDGASLTNYHICVPEGESVNQPCEREIARQCGEGFIDACLLTPPAAPTHVCVKTP